MEVGKGVWEEVGKIADDTQVGCPDLIPKKKYKFRVKAVNSEGESEPLVSTGEILAKDPWSKFLNQLIYLFI